MKKVINEKYGHLGHFVNEIPAGIFAFSGKTLYEGRNIVKLFEYKGKKYVVKKFKRPNFVNRLAYTFFRGSKAKRAYENAMHLRAMGVNTPTPVAYIDIKEKGVISTSYLVTEYTDWMPIANIANEDKIYQVLLTNAFIDFTVDLHKKGINHKDYNQTNVLYRKMDDGKAEFMLIDVNRMSFGYMSMKDCFESLKRSCEDSYTLYYLVQKYAEKRGWNQYRSVAMMAILRGAFETTRSTKKQIKEWVGIV